MFALAFFFAIVVTSSGRDVNKTEREREEGNVSGRTYDLYISFRIKNYKKAKILPNLNMY